MLVGHEGYLDLRCGRASIRGYFPGAYPTSSPTCGASPARSTTVTAPHEQDWIRACKESPEQRVEPSANFAYSGPFNEMVLLGGVTGHPPKGTQ